MQQHNNTQYETAIKPKMRIVDAAKYNEMRKKEIQKRAFKLQQ